MAQIGLFFAPSALSCTCSGIGEDLGDAEATADASGGEEKEGRKVTLLITTWERLEEIGGGERRVAAVIEYLVVNWGDRVPRQPKTRKAKKRKPL